MGLRRTLRQVARYTAQYGVPGADGPGDQILRRTLIPASSGGTSNVEDFTDLLTRRVVGITSGNIGGSGTQTIVPFGITTTQDGTAQAPISATPATPAGWNDGEGVFGGWSTATGTNALGGVRTTNEWVRRRHLPNIAFIIRNGVNQAISIDNCGIWLGFFSTIPPLSTTVDPGGHVAAFRWSTAVGGAGDSVVRVLTRDGTTLRNTASSTAFTIGLVTKFQIDMRVAGQIDYYINDVLVDSVSGSDPLPDNNQDLFLAIRIINGNGGGNATLRLSSLLASSN